MHTVTPMLVCTGAADALAWYARAYGAIEQTRLVGPNGKIMHAQMLIGDTPIMLTEEDIEHCAAGPTTLKGSPVSLHIYVEDVDAAFAKALAEGATSKMPVQDMFWGDRFGALTDPFGHSWSIATHIEDLTPEQVKANFEKMCSQSAAASMG